MSLASFGRRERWGGRGRRRGRKRGGGRGRDGWGVGRGRGREGGRGKGFVEGESEGERGEGREGDYAEGELQVIAVPLFIVGADGGDVRVTIRHTVLGMTRKMACYLARLHFLTYLHQSFSCSSRMTPSPREDLRGKTGVGSAI